MSDTLGRFLLAARTQGIPLNTYAEYLEMADVAQQEYDMLRARVRKLAAALRPFAEAADEYDDEPDVHESDSVGGECNISIADLFRARAALEGKP